MKYSEYRNNIRSGDVLAWSHEGWGSWHDFKVQMIRVFCRTEYTHVAIAWEQGGRLFAIENVVPCARIYPLSKLGSFYHIPMEADWSETTEEIALSYIGSPYSQWQAIKSFFTSLGRGNVSECAALVISVLRVDGIDLGDRATPDAVVQAAQEMGKPTYYVTS